MNEVLDGNAAAGALSEIFTSEVTSAVTGCGTCGDLSPIGALRAYMGGPGVILRCGTCDAVQIRVARSTDRAWVDLRGVLYLQVAAER
jgi:Family of unknown function (DUF6510)